MIRPARVHELAALSELALRSKAAWGYSPEFMAACRDELTVREEHLPLAFVLEVEGAVLGFYALSEIDSARAELEFLFVQPDALRRGSGRALVTHARARARERGYSAIVIQGDPHATGFYQAMGARPIGTRESDSIAGRMLPLYELAC
jgi:GNAT superfamily N-acetyltransferase